MQGFGTFVVLSLSKYKPMKNILTLLLVCFSAAAFAQAEVSLDKNTHNFGTFNEGADSVCVFTVTNTGNQPLVIMGVSKPCGCTTPDYTKEPIMPGKSGTITVKYSSLDHPGKFIKSLQVRTNAPKQDTFTITITGDVLPKNTNDNQLKPPVIGGRSEEVK